MFSYEACDNRGELRRCYHNLGQEGRSNVTSSYRQGSEVSDDVQRIISTPVVKENVIRYDLWL